ncbi:MAG: endopeptidase La [Mollicutes bacterium]|nr:endopeptidase La [Mollicutes bacterium]
MIKTNLPVILLRGIVLLPNNEIRLEFDNDISKNIIDVAELFHDNNLLVVSQTDPLEEEPEIKELPKVGVISKITHKMELPNGKTRVIIYGKKRAKIYEYLNLNKSTEVLESIVTTDEEATIDPKEEMVLIRKLHRDLENYIRTIPYASNSILALISNVNNLSKMTDIIAPHLPINNQRMQEYLNNFNPVSRAGMILEDIYNEMEMYQIEKNLELKVRKEIDNNQKEYLLREKIKVIKEELGDISFKEDEIDKLRERIKELDAPPKIIERLNTELKRYETLSQSSPEINVIRNYIDWLLDLPWNRVTEDNNDLKKVREILDQSHYGLDKVKTRIIEYLAVKQMSNSLRSPIICLVGPPGVGKTSLAFSIANAMNRNFVKISVGGVSDEAEIVGHRRTYLGANPGRIIQSLKKAKSSNPVFLIDEIDKMSKDYKGDPASCLLEILDPEQNKFFSDNYIEEEYDLSKVLFIATANYIDDIPEALKDRLEIIQLSGYTEFEKLDIAKKHLFPKICKEHSLEANKISMKDNVILKIIRHYTKEAGVRELERQLANIVRKTVAEIIVDKKDNTKYQITTKNLESYLGKPKYHFNLLTTTKVGVVNGLAYTYFGGDTLPIEVNYYKGNGNLVLTGSLGNVMKESAHIALSYIKSNYQYFHIDYDKLIKNDIHIHVPEGAIPKDGPSAGITLATALISAFTDKKIPATVAMTGEITLRGNILPIGGLKEKSIGAHRNGIKTIIIPYDNLNDLDEIPKEIKSSIEYIPVKHYKEVMKVIDQL